MRGAIRRGLAGALAALFLLVASRASAQTEAQLDAARAAFTEGVELSAEERWAEAAERFRTVLAIRATPQVKYNLAVALAHSGAEGEAADLLAEVAGAPELDRRTRRSARRLLDTLDPQLGRLIVRVLGDEGGVVVTLDGRELGLDRIGQALRVSAGSHRVILRRGEEVQASREVRVAAGETAEVSLAASPARGVDPAMLEPETLEPEVATSGGGSVLEEWWLWAAVGGAAVLIAGVAIGVAASDGGSGAPVQGNLSPGLIEVVLP